MSSISELESNLLYIAFNQDYTCLSIGTRHGYKLISFNSLDKFGVINKDKNCEILILERMFSSSLVAIVMLQAPRKLKVCHFRRKTEICSYTYSNTILSVKLNRQRLIVCLEDSIWIHNINDMVVMHKISNTPPNPLGICALSNSNDNCYLAYPSSSQSGTLQIFDAISMKEIVNLVCHCNPLATIAFNHSATKVATASDKGTVIRVFTIPSGQKIFEFRRGVKRCAVIHSLSFSLNSNFLCCSSNTETIHVFKLDHTSQAHQEDSHAGWMDYLSGALKSSASYLPSQVTDVIALERYFAVARLERAGSKNTSAITMIDKSPYLVVASTDGSLYIFSFDMIEGGECHLIKKINICDLPVTEEPDNDMPHHPLPPRHSACEVDCEKGMNTLKLNDDKEFPPVDHHN